MLMSSSRSQFSNKRDQGSMEEWLIPMQGKYKLSLGCLVVPENKEMIKTPKGVVALVKRTWEPT